MSGRQILRSFENLEHLWLSLRYLGQPLLLDPEQPENRGVFAEILP